MSAPEAPAAATPAIPSVLTRTCWRCHGDGWVEAGMHEFTNVGYGHRCANCAGTGFVSCEVQA